MAPSDATSPVTRVTVEPLGAGGAATCLLICALWGGTPVAISYSQDELPPVAVAGIRFALAAVCMLGWCLATGSRLRLRSGQLGPAWIAAVLLFAQISLFHVGIAWSNSSHATVLINTFVFWVAALEHFVTRTVRLRRLQALGLVFAAAGGLITLLVQESAVTRSTDTATLAGDLVLAASGFVLAVKIIYTKHALRRLEPEQLVFWHDVFGVLLFAAWSAAFETVPLRMPAVPTLLGLAYQGVVVAGFCFATQAILLRRHSASQISVYSVATPLFGLTAAFLFRGDRLSPWLILSGLCVAAGIYLVNARPAEG